MLFWIIVFLLFVPLFPIVSKGLLWVALGAIAIIGFVVIPYITVPVVLVYGAVCFADGGEPGGLVALGLALFVALGYGLAWAIQLYLSI